MSEDSGWADLGYDFSDSDSSDSFDLTDVSDYGVLDAAHPLDTAPVIEAGIHWAVEGIMETPSYIYEWGGEVIDDLVPDFALRRPAGPHVQLRGRLARVAPRPARAGGR